MTETLTCRHCRSSFPSESGFQDSNYLFGTCLDCRVVSDDIDIGRLDAIIGSIAAALSAENREAFLSLHPETLRFFRWKQSKPARQNSDEVLPKVGDVRCPPPGKSPADIRFRNSVSNLGAWVCGPSPAYESLRARYDTYCDISLKDILPTLNCHPFPRC